MCPKSMEFYCAMKTNRSDIHEALGKLYSYSFETKNSYNVRAAAAAAAAAWNNIRKTSWMPKKIF